MGEQDETQESTELEIPEQRDKRVVYDDDKRAEVLMMHARGWTYRKIEEKTGVSKSVAHHWCHDINRDEGKDAYIVAEINKNLANKQTIIANRLLAAMDDPASDRIDKAKLFELASSAKMLLDGARLIQGKSTQNISIIVKQHQDSKKEKEDLQDEIALSQAKIAALKDASAP